MEEPLRDDVCVACGGSDLSFIADRVYRCNACGFAAGSGFAKHVARLEEEQVLALSPARRRAEAAAKLDEARLALASAQGLFANAEAMSVVDVVGVPFPAMASDRGEAKQSVVVAALGELRRGHSLASEAALRIRGPGASSKVADLRREAADAIPGIDFSSLDFQLDVSWLDGAGADLVVHARISELTARTQRMRAAVERALVALPPPGSPDRRSTIGR